MTHKLMRNKCCMTQFVEVFVTDKVRWLEHDSMWGDARPKGENYPVRYDRSKTKTREVHDSAQNKIRSMTHISERNKWSMTLGVVMTQREGTQGSRGIITPFVCHRSKTEMWEVQESAQNRRSEAWLMSKAEIDEAWLKSGGCKTQ